MACMLGNVIGDALGAPTEFSPVRYNSTEVGRLRVFLSKLLSSGFEFGIGFGYGA
jgi:ADP-ribosylglycohydrolase